MTFVISKIHYKQVRYIKVLLYKESNKITTFITLWGRFHYQHTTIGHCPSQDSFTFTKQFNYV